MKYYLIVGEASGDLHASHLMRSLKEIDVDAQFRFFGGDMMTAVGGTLVRHYKELAYMGFVPVLMHLPTILRNMKMCKQDIVEWQPDCVILVDYPGFNLKIAEYVKSHTNIPVYYYISPKIWAWKEYRIKNIKRDVDELYSILPFEVDSPAAKKENIIALLAGSRKQEIKDNLPPMIEAVKGYENTYQIVVAGAPGIEPEYYQQFMQGSKIDIVFGKTYDLLARSHAALVTSGTATLETCLFGVPQVVCYKTPLPKIAGFVRRHMLKVKYVSLVNLVAGREVVRELVAESFSVANIRTELAKILDGDARQQMLEGYKEVSRALGDEKAPDNAARMMYERLNIKY